MGTKFRWIIDVSYLLYEQELMKEFKILHETFIYLDMHIILVQLRARQS